MVREMSEWFRDQHGHQWRAGNPAPGLPHTREYYEERYRTARARLAQPRGPLGLSKHLRKYWQKQLWTMRACLKSYFGAEPPADDDAPASLGTDHDDHYWPVGAEQGAPRRRPGEEE